jgi:hypothetical protein
LVTTLISLKVTWFSEKPLIIGDEIICGDGNDVEKAEKFLRYVSMICCYWDEIGFKLETGKL